MYGNFTDRVIIAYNEKTTEWSITERRKLYGGSLMYPSRL